MGAIRRIFQTMGFQDSMVKSYIDGMATKPSLDHIRLIEAFVRVVKPILVAKADVFYFGNINNSADSFRNLVKDSHHGTIQGSGLVWDNLVGFTNPNGTGWVDTNYNPATQGIKYTLNDAGMAVNAFSCPNIMPPDGGWLLSCWQSNVIRSCLVFNELPTYVNGTINDGANNSLIGYPFLNGFHHIRRDSSTTKTFVNQNKANGSFTVTSGSIPNSNFELFRQNSTYPYSYKFGLNVTYIGAALTDAEFATLNTSINEYLIGCLFLKYGNDNWGVRMAKSYFYDLHGFEKYEAFEVYEFIKRHQSDYTYTPLELSVNSGAIGLTDWVDSNSDGLADNWVDRLGNSTKSIVTGNGFTGNAQRIENTVAFGLYCSSMPLTAVGRTYAIKFKYRASNGFRFAFLGTSIPNTAVAANTGDAIETTVYFTATAAGTLTFSQSTGWLEVDEVSVKEVTESDIVNFNKCLNSGFGLATDFVDSNADGLADEWDEIYGSAIKSIVTGNGFTKNAQRVQRTGISGHIALAPSVNVLTNLIVGRSYTVYLKYRSNVPVYLFGATATIPANTGDAVVASSTFTAINTRAYFRAITILVGDWFEISEVLIIDNSNVQYLHNVFGPNGLNRSVADFILMLKSGGTTAANNWSKGGVATRFCQDGSITNSAVTMPAYTRGTNLGIFTITSIDGWNGYVKIDIKQTHNSVNSFYGNFPNILLLKTGGPKLQLYIYYCRCKANFNNQGFADKVYNIAIALFTYPGGMNLNISELIGGSYNSVYLGFQNGRNLWGYYGGDVTPFSTEFAPCSQVLLTTSPNLYGSMKNWRLDAITTNLYVNNTKISEGTSTWNKTIGTLYFRDAAFNTAAVDAQLKVINDYFAVNTPVKNIGITLNGASMGIPTGGANNADLLGIIAKHVTAGFIATITVRTS